MKSSNKKGKYRNIWSFSERMKLGISLIFTKLFYRKAKLICYPIYMRGKKNMVYGKGLNVGYGCHFDLINTEKKTLFIGENCEFGDYCHIVAIDSVTIGNNLLCASKVFISDCNHGEYGDTNPSSPYELPMERILVSAKVTIGNNVWLGENVVVLKGVNIGDGAIIGANSVVTHDIPSNTIAVGSPARVIKKYNDEKKIWEKI